MTNCIKAILLMFVTFLGAANLSAQSWSTSDIGTPSAAGTSVQTGFDFTLTSYGLGAGLPDDDIRFTSQLVNSNVEIIARLDAFSGGIDTAQAGLMLRKSNDSDSPFVSVAVTKGEGLHLRYRTVGGAQAYEIPGVLVTPVAPQWLRLVRSGGTIAGYHSTDGMFWELVGSVTFDLGADVYQGMFVSSGDGSQQAQADFQEVSAMHSIPQRGENLRLWLRSDAGVVKDGSGKVSSWEDQSGNFNDAVQATAASQPLYVPDQFNGKAALRFTAAANTFMTVPNHDSLNEPFINIFAVVKRNAGAASVNGVIAKNAGASPSGYSLGYTTGTNNLRSLVRGVTTAAPATVGDYDLISTTYSAGEMSLAENQTTLASTAFPNPLTPASHDILIGRHSTTTNDFDGDILEILVYSGELNELDKNNLYGYVHSKYGIGSIPPAIGTPGVSLIAPDPAFNIFSGSKQFTINVPFGSRVFYGIDGGTMTEYNPGDLITLSSTSTISIRIERAGYQTTQGDIKVNFDASSSLIPKSSLNLWFRADVGLPLMVLGRTFIWYDQSGTHSLAINGSEVFERYPIVLQNRINGQPTLEFNTTEKRYLEVWGGDNLSPNQNTILAVVKPAGGSGRILDKWNSTAGGYSLRLVSGTSAGGYINGGNAIKALAAGSTDQMILQTFDGSKIRVSTYGTGVAPTAPTETILSGNIGTNTAIPYIGGTAATNNFNGEIAEIMMFDRALNASEIKDLEAYVYGRYNIGVQPELTVSSSVKTGVYAESQNVALSSVTGAQIYYTTDGSDPVTNGTLYTGTAGIGVSATTTIKAYAVKTGYVTSQVITEVITIDSSTADLVRTGLKLWLKADVGVEKTGTEVSAWKDQSGNGNHASAQGTLLPEQVTESYTVGGTTYTPKVIRFAGSTGSGWPWLKLASASVLNSTNVSIYAVARRASGTTSVSLVEKTNLVSQGFRLQMTSDVGRGFLINGELPTATNAVVVNAPSANAFDLLGGSASGTTRRVFVNGVNPVVKTGGATIIPGANALTIGGYGVEATAFTGDIVEILAYEGALTDPEEASLRAYFEVKYGIGGGGTLPAPTADLASATYPESKKLSFTSIIPGTTIRYTDDGSAPTATSAVQPTGGIELTSGEKHIRAAAFKPGYSPSPVTERWIVIDSTTSGLPRANMWLWLNAGVGTQMADSVNVSGWRDQSGRELVAAAGGTSRPDKVSGSGWFNGHPFLSFNVDGDESGTQESNEKLTIPHSQAQNHSNYLTVFAAVRADSSVDSSRIVFDKAGPPKPDEPNKGSYLGPRLTYSEYLEHHGVHWASNYTASMDATTDRIARVIIPNDGEPRVVAARTTENSSTLSVNGGVPNLDDFDTPVPDPIPGVTPQSVDVGVGGRAASDVGNFRGSIAELIVYDGALNDQEYAAVEAYLNAKYGFEATKQFPAPTFNVDSGVYKAEQIVTITAAPGGTVYYTLNGTEPVLNAARTGPGNTDTVAFAGQITVTAAARITAVAVREGFLTSPSVTREIVIDSTKDLIPAPGSLALWLRADTGLVTDGSGKVSKWYDMSGNNLVASQTTTGNQPSVVTVPEAFGTGTATVQAVSFTGSSTHSLQIPDSPELRLASQGSVFALFERSSGTNPAVILEKAAVVSGAATTGYSLRHSYNPNDNKHHCYWQVVKTTAAGQSSQLSFPMPLASFHFSGGVLSSTTNQVWKNGSLENSAAYANGIGDTTDHPLTIGRRQGGTNVYPFTGRLVELWVYNTALTAADVQSLQAYLNAKYGYTTGFAPLGAVTVDKQPGIYDARVDVTLSNADAGSTIRYTVTEGTTSPEPTESGSGGTTFNPSQPVVLNALGTAKVWTITARSFRENFLAGPSSSWTYTVDPNLEIPKNGMLIWLRADQGVEYEGTTNKVTRWNDLSGLGNHVEQTIVDERPTYVAAGLNGKPVLNFSSSFLQGPADASLNPPEATVFAVAQRTGGGTGSQVVVQKFTLNTSNLASSLGYSLRATSDTNRSFYANGQSTLTSLAAGGNVNLLTGVYDKSADRRALFVDGVEMASATYAVDLKVSNNPLYIGGQGTANAFIGEISEILIYSRPLDATERGRVEQYLSTKYALNNLPAVNVPVLYPPGDMSASGPLQVAITADSGAVIHYTLDGSAPTTSSPVYTGPVWVGYHLFVKAIAVKPGYLPSPVASGEFDTGQDGPVSTPGDTTPPVINLTKPTHAIPQ